MDPDCSLFVEVVNAGSLSAAARKLRLSPAMVSKRLSRLEERLGARLIHRTTRRMATTEAGQAFFEDMSDILAAARAAEARVAGQTGRVAGRLSVSAPTSFGRLHIAPHLKHFLDRYPGVDLDIRLDDSYVDLITERLDLAIRISSPREAGLAYRKLAANKRVLCAAPAYLSSHGMPTDLHELERHSVLAATNQIPWRLAGPQGPVSLNARSVVSTNSSEIVRELAIAGHGIALRSLWDVNAELRSGSLVRIMPGYEGDSDIAIFAVHPRSSTVPAAVTAFVDYIESVFAPVPPWER
jgi:DNA-binding transcriptional LysR family regulator